MCVDEKKTSYLEQIDARIAELERQNAGLKARIERLLKSIIGTNESTGTD